MTEQIVTFAAAAFEVDTEKRTLSGVLLPFGEVSAPAMDGNRYAFEAGDVELQGDEIPTVLNYGHDTHSLNMQVGAAADLAIGDAGVAGKFSIAGTPEGDRVLTLASHKPAILRSFSAEVEGEFEAGKDGVMRVKPGTTATVTGGAVVRRGAFTGAQITSVAASAARSQEGATMPENDQNDAPVSFSAEQGQALADTVAELSQRVDGLAEIKAPVTATAQLEIREEPIYRFAGTESAPSGHDFATDLLAAGKDGDAAALARIQQFTAERFGAAEFAPDGVIKTGDTTAVNQPTYRPDMFLGQAPVPISPLYDFFAKGSLSSVQPFFWSKLDRTNTTANVHDHVEGADPAADDVATATGATVTPVPVDGKVHITREVADQGGNPQVSGLVWSEFERSLRIALETKTAALILAGLGSVTAIATVPTGTAGPAAGLLVEGGLVDLQFDPDGPRFVKAFGHRDLYKALATAANGNGEKIYPIIAPMNRDGQATSRFAALDIAGYGMSPAPSLGTAGGTKNSLVADPGAVHVWASGLQRLDKLQEKVEGWDMGVFAYFAGVLYDTAGLRKITYTP